MPEAPIDEHGDPRPRDHDIDSDPLDAAMKAESEPLGM